MKLKRSSSYGIRTKPKKSLTSRQTEPPARDADSVSGFDRQGVIDQLVNAPYNPSESLEGLASRLDILEHLLKVV